MKKLSYLPEPTDFYIQLRERINTYFTNHQLAKTANAKLFFKIALMFIAYFLAYTGIYFYGKNTYYLFGLYAFIGGWSVLLGLNIGHDAAHNAIFKKPKHNQILLFIFELLGTNAYNWKNRHLGAHHTFPNIMDYDSDVQQTNIVKIFPKDKHLASHAFQHLYMPFLYLFYIGRWIVYRDFKDAASTHIGAYHNAPYPKKELIKMIASKLFYLLYIIVIPALLLPVSFWMMCLAFFILTVSGSLVITMVLLSTHVGEDANFPEPDEQGVLPYSWSYHQVITSSDFSTNNGVITHLFGGFNHHVIHHLFPHICHIHYTKLTPILKEVCIEYNVPYRSKTYLIPAIISHFKLLKRNGQQQDTNSKSQTML